MEVLIITIESPWYAHNYNYCSLMRWCWQRTNEPVPLSLFSTKSPKSSGLNKKPSVSEWLWANSRMNHGSFIFFYQINYFLPRSWWPRCLRRRPAPNVLLETRVRTSLRAWMFVSFCVCVVLSGRDSCDGPIHHQKESNRMWCAWVWPKNLNNKAA